MARRRNNDISPEEFRELIREINKRMIIAGLIVIGVGLAIIGLMTLAYGG
ncbi:MAG TPA: ERF4 family protein [Candidatus Rothia avicola]|uniref:ERF4 family protein n=1 Tax=Candidatus Rothia avicola TaxID=2840478 RepID=A0A9D2CQK0_9MICC|nr:ERF4 family protein [Candidatus Rothia avicola]